MTDRRRSDPAFDDAHPPHACYHNAKHPDALPPASCKCDAFRGATLPPMIS